MKIINILTSFILLTLGHICQGSKPNDPLIVNKEKIVSIATISQIIDQNDKALYHINMNISPEERNTLIKQQMCRTTLGRNKASNGYRRLFYDALKECGHPYPELVIVEKDSAQKISKNACCDWNSGVSIKYVPKYLDSLTYGQKRICAFHEATHLVRKHGGTLQFLPSSPALLLSIEREADSQALQKANCNKCTMAYCHWMLNNAITHPDINLKLLQSYTLEQLKTLEHQLKIQSNNTYDTHPLGAERAVTAYIHAHYQTNELCAFHQQKALRSNQTSTINTTPTIANQQTQLWYNYMYYLFIMHNQYLLSKGKA